MIIKCVKRKNKKFTIFKQAFAYKATSMTYPFDNKTLDISSIKRNLTNLRKKSGVETSFNKLADFLNTTTLNLKDALSIFDRYVEYCNELKKEPKETMTFVMNAFEKFDEKELDLYLISLANLYGQVKTEYGLQFISQNLGETIDNEQKIELLFIASSFYCELKKYDDAFKTLRQANDLCYYGDLSHALRNKGKVSFKMAEIGQLENKPDVYLNYCINFIIYDAARELTNLPHVYPYFRGIEEFENKTYFLFEDEYFIEACSKMFGADKFQEIILDILKNQLFAAFTIDNSYCNEEKLKTLDTKELVKFDTTIRELKTLDVLGEIAVIINSISVDK